VKCNPIGRQHSLKVCEVSLSLVPYRDIFSDDQNLGSERVNQNSLNKVLGRDL
jgi:hypothetical protein